MSTEHPLTEDQLDALVNEIQDRLGDSIARKYGRRGVLAALGVAALGTGSASAQASGSVGTSSSPVDVEGYDVTASNSFTDPAGVTHSGELADLSDVGASGQWQEVNSGANIEPIDGETIGTGTEDVDVGSVSTDNSHTKSRATKTIVWEDESGVWYADGPNGVIDSGSDAGGVLQSAIDEAGTTKVIAIDLDPSSVTPTINKFDHVKYVYQTGQDETLHGGSVWHQTTQNGGINFWGTGNDADYQSISWYPEQRGTTAEDADVRITAHRNRADGFVDQEMSIYTRNGSGGLNKRLDIPYGSEQVPIVWRQVEDFQIFDGPISPQETTAVAQVATRRTYASGSWEKVTLDQNKREDSDLYSVDLTNNELTIQKDGTYRIEAQVRYVAPSDGTRISVVPFVNGSIVARLEGRTTAGGDARPHVQTPTVPKSLVSGDTIDLRIQHNEGTGVDIDGSPATHLSIERVGM